MYGSIAMTEDKADVMCLLLKAYKNSLLTNVMQIEGTDLLQGAPLLTPR